MLCSWVNMGKMRTLTEFQNKNVSEISGPFVKVNIQNTGAFVLRG